MEVSNTIMAFLEAYIAQQEDYHGSSAAHYPRAVEFVRLIGERSGVDPDYARKVSEWVQGGESSTVLLRDELLGPLGADYSRPSQLMDFGAFATLDSAHLHYVRTIVAKA